MVRLRGVVGGLVIAGTLLGLAAPLRAEEVRPSLNAQLLFNRLDFPTDNPRAFKESLRAVPATPGPEWEILPDGNARFGTPTLHVIVKNPCPGHGPVALPPR